LKASVEQTEAFFIASTNSMLARLQQLIAATLLVLTVAAVAIGATSGPTWLGPAFVALVVVGYGVVLAIEFAGCDRLTPKATMRARDRPVVPSMGAGGHGRAARLPVAPAIPLAKRARSLPGAARGRRGVLLVHGFFCNRGLWNRWLRGSAPRDSLRRRQPRADLRVHRRLRQTIADAMRRLEQATGLAPVIVGHSMGGLAARAWLASQPEARWHRLVTIASPHAGTRLGAHGPGANTAQMRLGSDWLAQLAARESAASRGRFICFWGHCDNIVFPTRSATLAGADNRHLPATPHVQMVEHPAVVEEVLRIVATTS
jgi:pimeloyl-ACP methyl ester carboxylesterase